MRDLPRISQIRFHAADHRHRAEGLYGWTNFVVDGAIHLDAVAVLRSRDRRWTLSFPKRRDAAGIDRSYLRPLNQAARDAIEAQVLGALRRGAHIP